MVPNSRTTSLTGPFHTGTKPFKTLCRLHRTPLLVFLAAVLFLQTVPLPAAAQQFAYVTNAGFFPSRVYVINTATNTVVTTIGGGWGAVSTRRRTLWTPIF